MTQTQQLLREFAETDSEPVFRQLVDQYVDLVFSTALRRLRGDRHWAEDATQIVFTDLARKAKSLPADVMLGGWLHRHCCFVVSNLCRADSRRAAREKEAVAMENLHGQDANWSEIAPELDEAINALPQEDRDAVVLRFFERHDFKAIGEAIGGSENAAQKRVARALEKLRHLLADRGVALSVTALMATLAREAVAAAPAALAKKTSASALRNSGTQTAIAAGTTSAFAITLWALAAAAVIGVVGVMVTTFKSSERIVAAAGVSPGTQPTSSARDPRVPEAQLKNGSNAIADDSTQTSESTAPSGPTLRLTVVAADTGNPIPKVPIEYHAVEGKRWIDKDLRASRTGIALIPFTEQTTELRLITRTEAFADTRLYWATGNSPIPAEYTLRLKRGVNIGGKVVNARGQLVPGATVDFSVPISDPELAQKTESHEIGQVHLIAEDGTWQTMRITEPVLRRMHASASHPDYAGSEPPHAPMLGNEIDQLLKGTHVFVLRDGMTVRGIVVNKQNEPVAGAKVLVGSVDSSGGREGVANPEGRFEIAGCEPGITTVTASAPGYGAKTVRVSSPPEDNYRIVLEPGRVLKMRIADKNGQPIPKASAWLKTMDPDPEKSAPLVQAKFDRRSDEQGLIEWDEAPADELIFDIAASGYMRKVDYKVAADGAEHTVTLLPALKISGTVRDAATGDLVSKFRVVAGYPENYIPPGETKPTVHWSTLDRYWIQGSNGHFEHVWEEPVVFGVSENNYVFKIEADGYRPYVTRMVSEEEGNATFDIALQSGDTTKLTVLAPNGQPAPDVDVAFLRRRAAWIRLNGRGIERRSGNEIRSTDAAGQVPIAEENAVKIVAAGAPGFAMIDAADLSANGTIQLNPWGRVQGKVTRHGKPVTDWQVHIGSSFQRDGAMISASDTQTDSDGNYVIESAPAGRFDLMRRVPSGSDRAFTWTPLREIQVASGQTTTADYEDNGVSVQVRVEWPAGFVRSATTKVFCDASTTIPRPSLEEMADPAAMARWRQRPEIKELLAKMRHHPLIQSDTNPDVWIADDLTPGDWTIGATVIEQQPDTLPGQSTPPQLTGLIDIQIPENSSVEKIDAGALILKKPDISPSTAH